MSVRGADASRRRSQGPAAPFGDITAKTVNTVTPVTAGKKLKYNTNRVGDRACDHC